MLASTDRDVYKFAIDDAFLYWAEPGTRTIKRVAKSGGSINTIVSLPDRPQGALAVDATTIFFRAVDDVRSISKNGGVVSVLATPVSNSAALTFDDVNVYYPTDDGVVGLPKKGGAAKTLVHTPDKARTPRNASRMPSDGTWVYYATYGDGVYRVSVSGGTPQQLTKNGSGVTHEGGFFLGRSYGPIVDCNRVFVAVEACAPTSNTLPTGVAAVALDGGVPMSVAKTESTDCTWQLGGLAEDSDAIYWSEHVSGKGSVWRTSKDSLTTTLVAASERPTDVAVDDRCVYFVRALDVGLPTARGEIVAAPIPR